MFLDPRATKTHGRAIHADAAAGCGLNIEQADSGDPLWSTIYELFVRTDNFVSTVAAKCIESKDGSFAFGAPDQ